MQLIKLGQLFKITSGGTPSKNHMEFYEKGNIPWIKTGDLKTKEIYNASEYITELGVEKSSAKLFPKNTVLIAMYGATIGATSILKIEATTNQACCAFLPSNNVIPEYLYYFFRENKSSIISMGVGGAQPNISATILKEIKIPIIDLDEQKKIVKVLDKAQELIDKRKAQIEALDELVKSKFIEMFGDPVLNPKGWKKAKLSNYIIFLTSGSRGWSCYFKDEGEMFLTIKNVKNNNIQTENMQYVIAPDTQEAKRTKVQEGDLLISITADLGRTGVVPKEIAEYGAYINQHLSLVRLNKEKINSLFISYFLESPGGKIQFEAKNQTGVKSGLNFDSIKSLEILVPPLKVQNEFTDFVSQVCKLKFQMQKSLEEMENNFNSLMQKAFKCELLK